MVHIYHTIKHYRKLLGGIPTGQTIIVSSLAASVQINQLGATKKQTILHGAFKSAISDISVSFQMHLRSDPTLDYSYQTSLILQWKLRGYKYLYPPTKDQKAIPANLVLHTTKKKTPIWKQQSAQLLKVHYYLAWNTVSNTLLLKWLPKEHAYFKKGI